MIQVGHNIFYELDSPPLPILPPDLEESLTVRKVLFSHSSMCMAKFLGKGTHTVFLGVMKTGRVHFERV